MINLYDQVPTIYSNASRDFQYLSWLFNIVLNSVKHNVDALYDLPNAKADSRLTELLALTLGFKVKRNYDQKQLAALVSIIPKVLKCKGTEKAIMMAGEALVSASGSSGGFSCKIKGNLLEAVLPEDLVDTNLFMDLLPYILPAGMTCRIVRKTQDIRLLDPVDIRYHGNLIVDWTEDIDNQISTGLSSLYNPGSNIPAFANFAKDGSGDYVLNTGLLDNTVIPVLNNSLGTFDIPKESEQNLENEE